MLLKRGARSSRPLSSASRRRAGCTRPGAPNGEWDLPHQLFGETPNRATGTVALPFSDCIVPASGGPDRLKPELQTGGSWKGSKDLAASWRHSFQSRIV